MSSIPPLSDRQAEAREWLTYARANVAYAEAGRGAGVLFEYLCFDAEQAAEKALKAALIVRGTRPPKIHDLDQLIGLLRGGGVDVPDAIQRAGALSPFAAQARYPGSADPHPQEEDLIEALAIAQTVIDWAARMIEAMPPE